MANCWRIVNYIKKKALSEQAKSAKSSLALNGAKFGKDSIFYPGSLLAHHSVVGDFNLFTISSAIAGLGTIGNNCLFGNNSCTGDKIKIAHKTMIGAGCYIANDVEEEDRVYVPVRTACLEVKELEIIAYKDIEAKGI